MINLSFSKIGELKSGLSLESLLKRPEITIDKIKQQYSDLAKFSSRALEQVEIAVKYEGYIKRQLEQVERFQEMESIALPDDIDYYRIPSISTEVREKLEQIRPVNLGQASRIQGITPAAVAVIYVYLKKNDK